MASKKSSRKPSPRKIAVDHYAAITDRIIEAMNRDGIPPWRRPWSADARGSMLPRNGVSGKPYRGINVMLTVLAQMERDYKLPIWVTAKQANELAARAARARGEAVEQNERGTWVFADGERAGQFVGGVRKGQTRENGCGSIDVYLWRPMEKREIVDGVEKTNRWLMMRSYAVFNVEQCEPEIVTYVIGREFSVPTDEINPIESAEKICAGFDCQVAHRGTKAYYSIDIDTIVLPARSRFASAERYYGVRFHEMGHATGAPHRLNREGIAGFDYKGSHQYAAEELVAEFTACFLAAEAGILLPAIEENSAAYLKGWAEKLKSDPKLVVHAAQRAQKAADLIMGRSQQQEAVFAEAA